MPPPPSERSRRDAVVAQLPVVFLVASIVWLAIANQHRGHDWGDDFALYLHQGKALIDGDVGQVVADNRFTLQHSAWHTFSPDAYPWGWPLLIAPVYAVFGLDIGVLKALEAVLFGGFLLGWYAVVRRRTGELGALTLMLLIGLSVPYLGWTDTVLSEFPYLCALGATWWWHDRCRERGAFSAGARWPLAVLGLLAAYTFSVRREGLAVVGGMLLADAVRHVRAARAARAGATGDDDAGEERTGPAGTDWSRTALPYGVGVAAVAMVQLLLPATIFQRHPGAGPGNFRDNLSWYGDIVAEHIGLKDEGYPGLQLLGSSWLGHFALGALLALALVGLVVRVATALETDAVLLGYLVLVAAIVGWQPFHEGRYLFSVTPLLAYLAWCGARWVVDRAGGAPRVAPYVASAVLGVFVVANATDAYVRTERRLELGDYVLWGPQDPNAEELFAAVHRFTEPDDVISFFRARAMTLYGERRAVQLLTPDGLLQGADYYAMEKLSTYSQLLLDDAQAESLGMVKVWENARFVLWRIR